MTTLPSDRVVATGPGGRGVPSSNAVGAVLDVIALLTALVSGIFIWIDSDTGLRAVAALVFVLFVPGWTVLRLARVPMTSLTLLGAFVLSFTLMVLVSVLLVTRLDWVWNPISRVIAFSCVVGMSTVLARTARVYGSIAPRRRWSGETR